MPQFVPGEQKTATVLLVAVPSGLDYEAELTLGPAPGVAIATSGKRAFVSTEGEQEVISPVTMPTAEGTYHVYVFVYYEGKEFGIYQADEDVSLVTPHQDAHTDSPHIDGHYDVPGEPSTHTNVPGGSIHVDSPHTDGHMDSGYGYDHGDYHGDIPAVDDHADQPHHDITTTPSPHYDSHYNTHTDLHTDV